MRSSLPLPLPQTSSIDQTNGRSLPSPRPNKHNTTTSRTSLPYRPPLTYTHIFLSKHSTNIPKEWLTPLDRSHNTSAPPYNRTAPPPSSSLGTPPCFSGWRWGGACNPSTITPMKPSGACVDMSICVCLSLWVYGGERSKGGGAVCLCVLCPCVRPGPLLLPPSLHIHTLQHILSHTHTHPHTLIPPPPQQQRRLLPRRRAGRRRP